MRVVDGHAARLVSHPHWSACGTTVLKPLMIEMIASCASPLRSCCAITVTATITGAA